ncbi:MAG: hypothetical protein ABEH65_04635 [Halobacteriales archaeon]
MTRRRGLVTAVVYLFASLAIGTVLWIRQPLVLPPGFAIGSTSVTLRLLALVSGSLLGSWLVFEIVRRNTVVPLEQ